MTDTPDALNLSALEGVDLDGELMTEAELEANGDELLWLSGEMKAPENVAYSLRRMDAGLTELLEITSAQGSALERIAAALEKIAGRAEKIADAFELPA